MSKWRFASPLLACVFLACGSQTARADTPITNFTAGDLVVVRGGDSTYSNNANLSANDPRNCTNGEVNVYLDEYTPTGAYVGTIDVPQLTLSGQSFDSHEGGLNLTVNGQYLTFGGYACSAGTVAHATNGTESDVIMEIGNTASSLTTVATIAGAGTSLSSASNTGQYLRAVNSVDGSTGFYVLNKYTGPQTDANGGYVGTSTDNAGLLYVTPGASPSTATIQSLQPGTDWRNVFIGNNTLYGGTGSSSVGDHDPYRIGAFGTLPTPSNVTVTPTTTSLTHTNLAVNPPNAPYQASVSDLALLSISTTDSTAGVQNGYNVMYTIGDQNNLPSITKWYCRSSGTAQQWVDAAPQEALAANNVVNPTGLVAAIDPSNPSWVDIYISGSNGIYAYVDQSGDPATAIPSNSFTQIATPQTSDMAFYGMAFAPAAATPVFPQWTKSGSGTWTNPQNWSSPAPSGVGAVADLWTMGGGTIDLGSSQVTLSTLSLYSTGTTSYAIVATGSGSLALQGSGDLPANVNVLGGKQMIAAPVTLSTSTDVAIGNSTDSLAISGAISGSGGLNLSGNGTLILSGSNGYGGGTTVESGTLIVNASAAIPDGTSLTVAAGGTVILDSSATAGPIEASSGVTVAPVPEPGTLALAATALLLAAACLWRRSKRVYVSASESDG